MEKIGIFGGTFNPVHTEHVNLIKSAIKELSLDKLFVVPTFLTRCFSVLFFVKKRNNTQKITETAAEIITENGYGV